MNAAARTVRIVRKAVEALDICSFELVDPDGGTLPPFSAGAHIDVHVPNGIVRQYSLCNDPREMHRYQIAVLLDPASRGGSAGMHKLGEGDLVEISDPKNHFPLASGAAHHLLVAGGIGITPLLCMAERLANIGASFEMHYCTRSPQRTAFARRIAQARFADRVRHCFDDGAPEQKFDAARTLVAAEPGTHLYVCGPGGFMDWVLGVARSVRWPQERLHREYFAAVPVDTVGDGGFDVQLASSGLVIAVRPEQSVVAALAAHGIAVPVSCEQGVCGTCLTRVLEGTPDHRDVFLTPDEQARGNQFTPCCSRSKSACLVLDL